MMDSHERKS